MTNPVINVLLVEDNPADVVFLREALDADALATFEVTAVERLSAALDIIPRRAFDVVLIDLGLPDSQGLATFTRLHRDFPDLPIVILSGLADEALALQTVQAGAQDYLVKSPGCIAVSSRAIRYAIERHQSQTILRASELRFKSLFEHSPVAYQSLDEQGLYLDVNDQLCRLTGYSAAELLGVSFGELWPPDVRPKFWPTFERFKREGAVHAEMQLVCKDGALIDVLLEGRIQHNLQGQFVRTHCILHDITERKRQERALRQSEADLAEAQSVAKIGNWRLDSATNALTWSDEVYRIFEVEKTTFGGNYESFLNHVHPDDRALVLGTNRETGGGGESFDTEYRIITPSSLKYIRSTGYAQKDDAGAIVGLFGIAQDITERKQAELALRQSEADLAEAQNVAKIGNWRLDLTTNDLIWSDELYRIFEVEKTAFGGNYESFLSHVHPDDRALVLGTKHKTRESGEPFDVEYRIVTSSDQFKYVREIGYAKKDDTGAIVGLFGIAQDITERKQAEAALRESETKFRLIAETIDEVFWTADIGIDKMIYISPRYERVWGCPRQSLYQNPKSFIDAIHPDDRARVLVTLELQKIGQSFSHEYRIIQPGGAIRHIWDRGYPIFDEHGQVAKYVGVASDITERKQAEIALRESEARFYTIFERSPLGIAISRLSDSQLIEVNPAFCKLCGYSREDIIGRTALELRLWVTPDDRVRLLEQLHLHKNIYNFEMVGRHNSGREYNLLLSAEIVKINHERSLLTHILDITERKQVEVALRLSEEKYRGLMESLDSVVATIDYEGRFLYVNDTAATQLGQPALELTGKTMADLFPADVAARQLESIQRVIAEDRGIVFESPSFVGGQMRWYRASLQPIHNETGQVIYALVNSTDIHDLKTAQQELLDLTRTLEARVQQRTAEVQDLYENAPTGYHSLDANGNFIMVNQTELSWLGYTRAELIGRPIKDIFTTESLVVFQQNFPVFKQRGWLKDLELEFIRKDGSTFPILVSATATYDKTGKYILSRSTVLDITERKKAEIALRESEEQNRLLFEVAPEAVVLFDENGVMVRLNRAFEQLTGYTQAQLTGHTLDELGLLPAAQIEQLARVVVDGLTLNNDFQTVEFSLRRASGERREIGTRVFGLKVKDRQHYLTTMRDITIEKQAEEALRLANAELMRAARAKDEFLATMSHELRTPLNAILGLSEALLEEVRGPLNERQRASLRNIEISGRHLLTLINDILDLSKVESGRLELRIEPIPVADVCQASLLFVKEAAVKKQLQLAFFTNDQLAKVEADPKRLKQMLVNLLNNAVKFTPTGGQISLEVNADAKADVTRFMVRDTGIGIAPADMARLFQPFTQLDSSLSRQHEGTGLGLALVRRLAELHGGSVSVESEAGRGSCFTIALPYHPPAAESAGSRPAASTGHGPEPGLRILVVDDSDSAVEQITRYLQEMNMHPTVHLQSENALARAISLNPDVIMLDLLMPGQSGWVVLAQLKADPRTRAIPVIVVSVMDERAKGLAGGASEYLVKPVSRETLRQALATVVIKPQTVAAEAMVVAPQANPAGARILLAEDSDANILPISDYLVSKGYQLAVARNGLEALDQASTTHPDLILMDIQMPELDGLEAIRRLRAWPEFAGTPIIALTALAMPGDRERCLAAGADEYLTKPVRLKSLIEAMERLLQKGADK